MDSAQDSYFEHVFGDGKTLCDQATFKYEDRISEANLRNLKIGITLLPAPALLRSKLRSGYCLRTAFSLSLTIFLAQHVVIGLLL